jgi:cystathionine beta-lyase/cystathionine gamma-synthase
MAATTTLFTSLLKSGDHVVCSDVVYGGTVRLIETVLYKFGVTVSFVDSADSNNIAKYINKQTKLIFIETPANPTLKLNDIKEIAKIAKANKIPLAVDNTFLTAVLQKPLSLGADIVLYSTTKYIDGHNATVGGALLARNKKYIEKFAFNRKTLGSIQSPFDAWLILQGLKTLELRIKQHSKNALVVAKWLEKHKNVSKVLYPGLKSFPQYELAKRQHDGYEGGMIAFEVIDGYTGALKIMNSVKLCTLAESLGSLETLITHPASMTHGPIVKKQRDKIGITDGLIRLSVGLEDPEDIIHDLEQAFLGK